ncbi:uncharacterized protein LOC118179504 isoform X2 [Stegodyphus dumicola]|uniref:uncharacterized protein LOC118179504 isoform X2 n=1 Tax=Stegodyphus dumicola TaxID=202533 RepID=UPI0015B22188|nr:uncharacterized protein LOC118179504 isoform X2 [Stegodyphus dumicola]
MMWAKPMAFGVMLFLFWIATIQATDLDLEFRNEPISQLVNISDGKTVFRCSASPSIAQIQWLYKGQPVPHNRWIKVSDRKLTVHLGRMEKGSRLPHHLENGYFQCEVRLKGKVLVSAPAKLILAGLLLQYVLIQLMAMF